MILVPLIILGICWVIGWRHFSPKADGFEAEIAAVARANADQTALQRFRKAA